MTFLGVLYATVKLRLISLPRHAEKGPKGWPAATHLAITTPRESIMRSIVKSFISAVTATALTGVFAGGAFAQEMLKEVGKGEGQVDILAWAGYIENGSTDKNFDWVTEFTKKTGCAVNVKPSSSERINSRILLAVQPRVFKLRTASCKL